MKVLFGMLGVFRKIARNTKRYLVAVNFNPVLVFDSLAGLPRFLKDRRLFAKNAEGSEWPLVLYPILHEWNSESANLGEYFWQDLYVAKRIINETPQRHIDVGSRVDGVIAHLACVRDVEVFDIRPLTAKIENVTFTQWDITNPRQDLSEVADCVTCLHTLEHIGLGRYGDPIDPNGWKKGLSSLVTLMTPEGGLWLSVPIGSQRVEFNAHRVFAPQTIVDEANRAGLSLNEFHFLEGGVLSASVNIQADLERLATVDYALGIFRFKK